MFLCVLMRYVIVLPITFRYDKIFSVLIHLTQELLWFSQELFFLILIWLENILKTK